MDNATHPQEVTTMEFPSTLNANPDTRAGRMLAQGDVRVTIKSHKTGQHLTIRFKAFLDTRDAPGKNWTRCPLEIASHVFVEVPTPDDGYADKVGTFYPKTGRWFSDRSADKARVFGAAMAARWLNGEEFKSEIAEEERCGKCARRLTDPVSIARGIGPECYGQMTGSAHQVKGEEADTIQRAKEEVADMQRDPDEVRMQQMEMIGDREQTMREEQAKAEAKRTMETPRRSALRR